MKFCFQIQEHSRTFKFCTNPVNFPNQYHYCLSACWTEPTDFKSRIQTGVNVNTNTFQTGLGCNLDNVNGTTHANKSHPEKKIAWQGICDFRTAVSCKRVDIFNFHSDFTSSRAHVNGPLLGEVSLALPLSFDWMFKA